MSGGAGDFRLLVAGQVASGLGSHVALVAPPTQIFLLSDSAALVSLLGHSSLEAAGGTE